MIAPARAALLALLALAAVLAIACGGDGESEATPTATAAATAPAATSTATPAQTATPTATRPPSPAATPAATSTPAPTATATATPTPAAGPAPVAAEGVPYSLSDLADALAPGGIEASGLYDPAAACAGAAVEGVPFVAAGDASAERFAVWVLWVYPDVEAREGDWRTGQRAEPLVEGCEPPNGFVYWNENLLLWFSGFFGDAVEPGSPPLSLEEVREHPVVRAFLGLTR